MRKRLLPIVVVGVLWAACHATAKDTFTPGMSPKRPYQVVKGSYGVPNAIAYGVPHGVPYGIPHGVPYGQKFTIPYGVPYDVPYGIRRSREILEPSERDEWLLTGQTNPYLTPYPRPHAKRYVGMQK